MIDEPLRDFDMHIVTDSYGNKSLWTRVTTTTGTYDSVLRLVDQDGLSTAEFIEEFVSPALLDMYNKEN